MMPPQGSDVIMPGMSHENTGFGENYGFNPILPQRRLQNWNVAA